MILALPCELVFKILMFMETSSLRNLRKIVEFSHYFNEIDRIEKNRLNLEIEYRTKMMNFYIYDCLREEITNNIIRNDLISNKKNDYLMSIIEESYANINVDKLINLSKSNKESNTYYRIICRSNLMN